MVSPVRTAIRSLNVRLKGTPAMERTATARPVRARKRRAYLINVSKQAITTHAPPG